MERSGPSAAVAAQHFEDLRELVARPGPFLTVVATCPQPIAKAVDAAVHEVRHAVATSPASDRADEVAALAGDAFPGAAGVVIIAEADRVALVEHLDEPPRHVGAHYSSLPMVTPILERRAADLPVVMAIVDRTGADLSWSTPLPAGATAKGEATIDGDTTYIRKVQAGGWSHRRFQQRAEDTWEHTATDVSEAIASAADAVDARLIVIGGDDRMIELTEERLPTAVAAAVRRVPGSRSEDGSDEERDEAARRWLRTAVAEDTRRVLELFNEAKGQAGQAADGTADTLGALREARVDLLLVNDPGTGDEPTACFAPGDPTMVATTPAGLEDLGADDVRVGRAVDVAIRSALLTGADVRIVPSTPRLTDGIGALLRW